jgi:hypothetical protein
MPGIGKIMFDYNVIKIYHKFNGSVKEILLKGFGEIVV